MPLDTRPCLAPGYREFGDQHGFNLKHAQVVGVRSGGLG